MASSVRLRPDHYGTLGISAAAGEGEVARAFAGKMSLFGSHRMDEAARICAAYEVLRDPVRRRDYDRSIGLGAKAEPRQWAFAMTQAQWPGFVGAAAVPAPEPQVTVQPPDEVSPELERATTIARSLHKHAEPAAAEPAAESKAEAESWPLPTADPDFDIYRILDRRARLGSSPADGGAPIAWKRPALAVGGFVAAAGLIGALAGLSVKDDAASAAAAPAVTVPLPAAKEAAEAPAATVAAVEVPVSRPKARRVASHSQFARAVESEVADAGAAQAQPAVVETAATESAATQPVAASLPLPDRVVARTIERIGYSCGKVTGAVAGASPGVYSVTCSSGETYQATPVHGRYRFRRAH